jgi:DNA-binding response OmpR family regulator
LSYRSTKEDALVSQKPKILLLDDDMFHRGLLAEGLEDYYDFEVTKVDSLASARRAIQNLEPDLLLLDLVVGDDRFQVLQWVQELRKEEPFKKIPVLFVTAYFKEMEEHVRGLEGTAILEKPFRFEDVTQGIRKLLGQTK